MLNPPRQPGRRTTAGGRLSVASIATLIVTADTGQLSIALPLIITEFGADLTLASWIALVYALITASLYLPCGRMSDLLGIGNLFLAGFILYALSSIAAGSSQSAVQLVIFRALQAAGSALIMANNFALVTALFPPEERGRAMGIAGGAISAIGYTMGPVIGGLLTHGFGWRSNFFVSSALAIGGFAAARMLLPPESFQPSVAKGTEKEPFDLIGALSFACCISLILFGLATAQKGGWQSPLAIVSLIAGFALLFFFIHWERRARAPLLDLALFRIPAFTLGNVARWISFITMSVSILLMPFYLAVRAWFGPAARRIPRRADALGDGAFGAGYRLDVGTVCRRTAVCGGIGGERLRLRAHEFSLACVRVRARSLFALDWSASAWASFKRRITICS